MAQPAGFEARAPHQGRFPSRKEKNSACAAAVLAEQRRARAQQMGVAHVFTPGTRTDEIVDWVRENVAHAA